MTRTIKKKGPAKAATFPSHVQSEPVEGSKMNTISNTTPAASGRAAALAQATYAACTEASNIANLLNFIARTAQTCAHNSTSEEGLRFHEIRMMVEGAGRMLDDHAEALDSLSIKVGALGAEVRS